MFAVTPTGTCLLRDPVSLCRPNTGNPPPPLQLKNSVLLEPVTSPVRNASAQHERDGFA